MATIEAMLLQEETGYTTRNYLHCQQQSLGVSLEIDAACREAMVQWCYQCTDYCRFSHESVEVAVSCLDRYLMTEQGLECLNSEYLFQLTAMTCLYIAVKMIEPEVMSSQIVSGLSRGLYKSSQIEEVEMNVLKALNWRMNPPTITAFVREFLVLTNVSSFVRDTVMELCKLQVVLALKDYSLVPRRASEIAFAALSNALDSLGYDKFTVAFSLSAVLDENHEILRESIQFRLYSAIAEKFPCSIGSKKYVVQKRPGTRVQHSGSQRSSPRSILR